MILILSLIYCRLRAWEAALNVTCIRKQFLNSKNPYTRTHRYIYIDFMLYVLYGLSDYSQLRPSICLGTSSIDTFILSLGICEQIRESFKVWNYWKIIAYLSWKSAFYERLPAHKPDLDHPSITGFNLWEERLIHHRFADDTLLYLYLLMQPDCYPSFRTIQVSPNALLWNIWWGSF